MVIDTSALMAILQGEPEAPTYVDLIERATVRLMSAVSMLEAGMLAESRKGDQGGIELDSLVRELELAIVAFDAEQTEIARTAFRRFGKGRHHAGLNFGDCAAYALAQASGEPLLFKGNDFARTDVRAVSPH
jgi:ribonuclease VapC